MEDWRAKGPLIVDAFVSAVECDRLLAYFASNGDKARSRSYQGLVDASRRLTEFIEVPADRVSGLLDFVAGELPSYFGIEFDLDPTQPILMYRYPPGIGFEPHHDEVTEIELMRAGSNGQPVLGGDVTVVLLVNDPTDYSGGELFFPDHGGAIAAQKGSVVAFPATTGFVHGVAPIRSGDRYTVVLRVFRTACFLNGADVEPRFDPASQRARN